MILRPVLLVLLLFARTSIVASPIDPQELIEAAVMAGEGDQYRIPDLNLPAPDAELEEARAFPPTSLHRGSQDTFTNFASSSSVPVLNDNHPPTIKILPDAVPGEPKVTDARKLRLDKLLSDAKLDKSKEVYEELERLKHVSREHHRILELPREVLYDLVRPLEVAMKSAKERRSKHILYTFFSHPDGTESWQPVLFDNNLVLDIRELIKLREHIKEYMFTSAWETRKWDQLDGKRIYAVLGYPVKGQNKPRDVRRWREDDYRYNKPTLLAMIVGPGNFETRYVPE